MAILDTIYNKVVIKTARPDRVNEIQLAIVDAINEYHSLAFFERDIVDATLTIGNRDSKGLNLRTLIPNLRKIMGVFICGDQKLPRLPHSGEDHCPGYKLLGNTFSLNPSNLATEVKLLYSVSPTPENSWIAEQYPDAVASLAAFKVANLVGNKAGAAALALEVGAIFPSRTGYKNQIMMENDSYEPDA